MKTQQITKVLQGTLTAGYFARMYLYLRRMYPLQARILNSLALYTGFTIVVCRLNALNITLISIWTLLGIADLFLLALLLRLMDELKDREVDRALFSDRPVPSGLVLESDIRNGIFAVTCVYVVINLLSPTTLWLALMSLGYAFLMFAYFFVPILLRRYLLLNLATHNPSVPLFLTLAAALVAAQHGRSLASLSFFPTIEAIAMFWFLLLGWELARKIRSQEEENDYVTYSQIFGRVPATVLTLAVQTVPFVLGLIFSSSLEASVFYYSVLSVAYALLVCGYVRFIVMPSPATSQLRPLAEWYTMLVILAVVGDYVVTEILRGTR